MATTVDGAFRVLHEQLTPTQTEIDASKSHRASVLAKLNDSFGVTSFFRTGSFGNGTSLRGFSDVDYFASIPLEHQRDSSLRMLTVVRDALTERFPKTTIAIRSPAVILRFGNQLSETYEIVPAYYQGQEKEENSYKIPDGDSGWIKSAPLLHNRYVTERNDALGRKLKPLIRFLKVLKLYRNIPVGSFYLELRTTKWSEGETTISYSHDIRSMLKYLVDNSLAQMRDPMGVSGYVSASDTENMRQDALSKLGTALARATKAREAEGAGEIRDAFEWWDKVFDGHFPAYG